MKKNVLKSEQGFTLVELMVVVAIIGILSAIAVPNFKKYQAKSKQSEAKIQLAAVYTTEVGANADYDTYATCILSLGYEQSPKGYYIVGFKQSVAAGVNIITQRSGTCGTTTADYAVAPVAGSHLKVAAAALPAAGDLTQSVDPTNTTFTAGATGNISGTLLDKWTINQAKALINAPGGY